MHDESPQDRELKELWQSQRTEGVRTSVAEIQASAAEFQRRIQWRNAREYIAAAAMVLFFGFEFWRAGDLLVRIGFALLIAGICLLVWQLHVGGSWSPLPGDPGLSSYVEYKRRELERQRDALKSVWRWYLGPLLPGFAVLLAAFCRANPGHLQHPAFMVVPEAIFFAAVSFGIAKLNGNAARKMQEEIDELEEGLR